LVYCHRAGCCETGSVLAVFVAEILDHENGSKQIDATKSSKRLDIGVGVVSYPSARDLRDKIQQAHLVFYWRFVGGYSRSLGRLRVTLGGKALGGFYSGLWEVLRGFTVRGWSL
jgi:hypothetical protein